MANRRVGGILYISVDGLLLQAKGEFTVNLGVPKRSGIAGQDSIHGFSEVPQLPTLSGSITDSDELDMQALLETRDATITVDLANGKSVVYSEAWFSGDGNMTTSEGEIEVEFQAIRAEEFAP